ncbi:plastid-lipid associated protein PAP / fibrillinfamily protein [Striga asiatica]|uniref:Plastid-lipid associated protein PAP / fibrillinfamily protein n=1 Tax=Striga asiatica TaxID=4170 RepID=A0A5A7P055_STRAF|nr:plastid-lipid associated protein PAP / fibrillinfamily protein [Striga asiatica]
MACSISVQSLFAVDSTRYLPSAPKHIKFPSGKKKISINCRAIEVQTVQGPSAAYAKDMERISAKESLLLAFKDAGGFEAVVTGKLTSVQRIDVNERIVNLERLNPTPRPTTSPYLEGQWNFEWFGSGTPGFYAVRLLFGSFPPTLANFSKLDVVIKDGYANISAAIEFLNSVESIFTLSTKLSIEGPLRMKEEYTQGTFGTPKLNQESIPEQLKSAFGRAASSIQQLPVPITDAVASGLKVPLPGTFERLFMISYLDEDILITRDTAGLPEVLTRLSPGQSPEPIVEYES